MSRPSLVGTGVSFTREDMQLNVTSFWLLVGLCVAIGSVLSALFLGFFVGSRQPRSSLHVPRDRGLSSQEAEISMSDFRRELQMLRKKREIINVYSGDYFHTLQDSGWDNLQRMLSRLSDAETRLQGLCEAGRYAEAYQLSEFLLGRLPPEEAYQAQQEFHDLQDIWLWRSESGEIVINLLQNLEAAALQTQEIGVSRNRNRKPTLMAISDLQNLISK